MRSRLRSTCKRVMAAMERLPDEQREVVALILIEGFGYREDGGDARASDRNRVQPFGSRPNRTARIGRNVKW